MHYIQFSVRNDSSYLTRTSLTLKGHGARGITHCSWRNYLNYYANLKYRKTKIQQGLGISFKNQKTY
jgi:hypothetical protein